MSRILVIGRPGLSPRNIKTFECEKDFRIVTVPDTTCHWLAMNQTKKPLDDVKVRQAINYAIPVAAIVPNVLMGYGAAMKSPVPALTPGHDASLSPYKYDLDKARALMKEAGVTAPVTLDLATPIEQVELLERALGPNCAVATGSRAPARCARSVSCTAANIGHLGRRAHYVRMRRTAVSKIRRAAAGPAPPPALSAAPLPYRSP